MKNRHRGISTLSCQANFASIWGIFEGTHPVTLQGTEIPPGYLKSLLEHAQACSRFPAFHVSEFPSLIGIN